MLEQSHSCLSSLEWQLHRAWRHFCHPCRCFLCCRGDLAPRWQCFCQGLHFRGCWNQLWNVYSLERRYVLALRGHPRRSCGMQGSAEFYRNIHRRDLERNVNHHWRNRRFPRCHWLHWDCLRRGSIDYSAHYCHRLKEVLLPAGVLKEPGPLLAKEKQVLRWSSASKRCPPHACYIQSMFEARRVK